MNAPALIYVFRWLIRDTFRQAMATRIFWLMLAVSGLCIVFCLGVSVEGGLAPRQPGDTELYDVKGRPVTDPSQVQGRLSLLFGAVRVDIPRDREHAVHFLQVLLATWVAGTVGLLLTLVWTAGFLPDFLQPSSAAVLFAKPVPRWVMLVGKYLGVLTFVTFQASVFFVGTWLALSLKTNVWLYAYLAGIPLLVLHFAVIYSFSVLLAVCTRSTVACVFGSILFWLVCFGMNYGRYAALALPELAPQGQPLPAPAGFLIEAGYWILPKPLDMVVALEELLEARKHFTTVGDLPELRSAQERGLFQPELSLLTSLLFGVVMLALAGHQLGTTDY